MTKHILIIVDSIDVNDSSGSKANVALIKNLAAIGYGVVVLHFTQKDIYLEGVECTSIKEKKYIPLYFLSRTQRIIQRYFKINLAACLESVFGFSFTFFNDVNSIKSVLKKLDISKFDLILTLSKGASFRPHYAINKLPVLHEKWMAYIHDPFPMCCYPPPYNWKEPGHRKKQNFFKEVSENAKLSAFPSLLLKDWMGSFFENFNKSGIVIPHQIINLNLDGIDPVINLKRDMFNILHAGSLFKQRNPKSLIMGYQLFLENNIQAKENSKLILLGSADYHKAMIEDYAKSIPQLQINLSNIPFRDVILLQSKVAVNVILESDAEISPFLPGKFPHCISANKPILHLGPKNSETMRLLNGDYQYHSSLNDVGKIANNIEYLYNSWLKNGNRLSLNREDLKNYVSTSYLEQIFYKIMKEF
jgi:hypothetical protein